MGRLIERIWYWIRCHTYNRYHILSLKVPDEYDWGWRDTDSRILYACFNLFKEFVEKEVGYPYPDLCDIEWDEKELQELYLVYRYWVRDRPKKKARILALLKACEKTGVRPLEAGYREEDIDIDIHDEKMLRRLMALRPKLWT